LSGYTNSIGLKRIIIQQKISGFHPAGSKK
jgi:hypothetical protein